MPINRALMKSMKKEYGKKSGKEVYYKMENKMKHESPRKAKKIFNVRKDK